MDGVKKRRTLREWLRSKRGRGPVVEAPPPPPPIPPPAHITVTLLITTFQRAKQLRNSLERLCTLTLPDEIIVVDDGGTDETAQVCAEFTERLPITYVYNNNPGTSICSLARNIGVKMAKGDLIVTSEPELIWETDVIAQFYARWKLQPNDVISAGHITMLGPEGEDYQEAIGWVAPHTAMYVKRWLIEVGGWDETFPGDWGWDDTDLLTRLRLNGHGQSIDTSIKATHQWHGLGGDPDNMNEQHFLSKSYHANHDTDPDLSDVVANQNHEWGVLRT